MLTDSNGSSGVQADGLLGDEMKTLSELKLDNCNYLYAMDVSGSSGFVLNLYSLLRLSLIAVYGGMMVDGERVSLSP